MNFTVRCSLFYRLKGSNQIRQRGFQCVETEAKAISLQRGRKGALAG